MYLMDKNILEHLFNNMSYIVNITQSVLFTINRQLSIQEMLFRRNCKDNFLTHTQLCNKLNLITVLVPIKEDIYPACFMFSKKISNVKIAFLSAETRLKAYMKRIISNLEK